ncbi:MAG: carbohydrate ABC transporter substrate-binding protein [Oscillospiraceae bacterium]|nr:carbohydrate ABC transporter substrate-binding protein [Oscillospiraceae bacterium]
MKKKISIIACLTAAVLALASCGGDQTANNGGNNDGSKQTTLRIAWWGGQPRNEGTISVIDMYKAKNSDINVETEYSAWDGYWDKMATQMAAKNLPDIMQQDYAYLGQWIEKNQLSDLTEFVDAKTIDLSNIGENFIGGNINGGIYGISLGTNALAMVYNADCYKAAGIPEPTPEYTWSQFMSDAEKIKAAGFDTELIIRNDPKFAVEQMVREQGKTFYNADGTALGFDDPKMVEDALTIQSDLIKKNLSVDKDISYSVQNVEESLLLSKKVWNEITWSNLFVPVNDLANEQGFGFSLAIPPRVDGAAESGVYLKPSMLFSVTASSQNKEESAKFINYFINDIEANKVLSGERGVPVSSAVRDALRADLTDSNKKVYDYIDLVGEHGTQIDPPEPEGSKEISATLKTIFQEIVYGTKTPKDGAAEFMQKANEILAENK